MDRTDFDTSEAKQTRLLGLEVIVYLISVVTIDVRLGHQREGNTVVTLAKGGDAGIILRFLTTKLRSRYYQTNPVDGGKKNTWLDGKPRITRPLSCRTKPMTSVCSYGEKYSAYLVLIVEALETCLVADVSVPLAPGAEESG